MDLHDVFQQPLDPNRGVDPEVLQRISAGQRASGELDALQGGSAMANALRMSQAQLPGIQGSGAATTAPGIANALAVLGSRYMGNKRLREMDQQAAALRGQVAAGDDAAAERKMMEAAYRDKMARENQMANMRFQQKQAEDAEARRIARENRKAEELRENQAQEQAELDALPPDLPSQYRKDYKNAYSMVKNVNRVKSNAEDLSQSDVDTFKSLRNRIVRTGLENLTPQSIRNLAKEEGLDLSEASNRFLNSINGLSVEQRHRLFGTQVTRGEEGIAVTILPSAPDLSLDGMMLRLDEQGERNMLEIRNIEDIVENEVGKRPNLVGNLSFKRWGADKEGAKSFDDYSTEDLMNMSDADFEALERSMMQGL